ncbi:hypothetical protein FFF34_002590 [Inquilinus sp. KBS0705]|nr:hypothetical protein FFF34_002590 [Inquilinus sp. KBS0705]
MLKLRSRQSKRELLLDRVQFFQDEDGSYFLLESSEDQLINYTVNFPLPYYDGYKIQDFNCIGFSSSIFNKENNIFQVNLKKSNKDKPKRIGWIFTIQALISTEHNEANNEHFLRYSFVTFEKLLRGHLFEETVVYVEDIKPDGILTLENIYPAEMVIFTISNATVKDIPEFEIDNYLQSFYIYGYYFCPLQGDFDSAIENLIEPPIITNIVIQKISDQLEHDKFAKELFRTYLKKQNHPLVQFYLLFQVIELLIDKVYDFEILKLFSAAKERTLAPHEIKKRIESIANMDYRITRLFEDYLQKGLSSTTDLVIALKHFLKHFASDYKDTSSVGAAIYSCRNKIVHEFRLVADKDVDFGLLKEINKHFSILIAELVILFADDPALRNNNKLETSPIEWLKYQLLQEILQKDL